MPLMGREQRNGGRRHLLGLFGGDFAQRERRSTTETSAPVRASPITKSISQSPRGFCSRWPVAGQY